MLPLRTCFAWPECCPGDKAVAAWVGPEGSRRAGFVSATFTSEVATQLSAREGDVEGCMRLFRLQERWYREHNLGLDTFQVGDAFYTVSQRVLDSRCPPGTPGEIRSFDYLRAMPGSRYFLPATVTHAGAKLLERMPDHYRSPEELMHLWSAFCDGMYDGEHLRWHSSSAYRTVMKAASMKDSSAFPCPQLARFHHVGSDPDRASGVYAACRAMLYSNAASRLNGDAYRDYVATCLRPLRKKRDWHFTVTCRNVLGANPYVQRNTLRFDFVKAACIEKAVWQRYSGQRIDQHEQIEEFVDRWAPSWRRGAV